MALTHEQAQERFDPYREGELEDADRRAMDEHLAGCEACRTDYTRFLETMALLGRMGPTRAPQDFVQAVQDQVRRRSRGRFFGRRVDWSSRLPYEVLSVVMLIAIIAIFLFIYLGRGGGAALAPK
jgi:anti-sigma factor RsiW